MAVLGESALRIQRPKRFNVLRPCEIGARHSAHVPDYLLQGIADTNN